jgi:hypothetical protein
MNFKVDFKNEKEKRAMKDVFGGVVAKLGEDPKFVYLDADLMSSIGTKKWADAHPNQAYNVGVSEANLAGMAAGLSAAGLKPWPILSDRLRPAAATTRSFSPSPTRKTTWSWSVLTPVSQLPSMVAHTCRLKTWPCIVPSRTQRLSMSLTQPCWKVSCPS